MQLGHHEPINLGQDRMITINGLVENFANISGIKILKRYDLTKQQGLRGRISDKTRLPEALKWKPEVSLKIGLGTTYKWTHDHIMKTGRLTSEEHNTHSFDSFQYQNPAFNPKNN